MLHTLDEIDRPAPAIQHNAARYAFDLFASLAAITILAPLAAFAVLTASWRVVQPADQPED